MPPIRRILVVDPDLAAVRALAPALRRRGYQVHAAADGARALQIAILRPPDLVLLDAAAPLVAARTFVRILRTNPRTEAIPVLLRGTAEQAAAAGAAAWLPRGCDEEALAARVEQALRRADAARAAAGESGVEGSLAELPLTDLLQVLAANRRTGRLTVVREHERAWAALEAGRIVDAGMGEATGAKALYRLLTRRDGAFAFAPGPHGGEPRIDAPVELLVLDGVRQGDEIARLVEELPGPHERLERAPGAADLPADSDAAAAELLALLDVPRAQSELVDRCRSTDLEALRALRALLADGRVRRAPRATAAGPAALLSAHALEALRARLARAGASGAQTVGKVLLVAAGAPREDALSRLAAQPGFRAGPGAHPLGFGTVGRLVLGEGVEVDVAELPTDAALRPLWRPFAATALGVLALAPGDGDAPLLLELSRTTGLPLAVCAPYGAAAPRALRETPGDVALCGADPLDGLRRLLDPGAP